MAHKATLQFCAVFMIITGGTAIAAGPQKKPASATNMMAKIPMRLGYYVNVGESCANPGMMVRKFGANAFWDIDEHSVAQNRITGVIRKGAWYQVTFVWEGQEPQVISVQPKGPGRIAVIEQDDFEMQYCAPEQVPAKFRK